MADFKSVDKLIARGDNGISKEREAIVKAFQSAVVAVHPSVCMKEHIRLEGNMLSINAIGEELSLDAYKVLVSGMGKSTAEMAIALESILSGVEIRGVISLPQNAVQEPERIRAIRGSHPVPDRNSFRGGREMLGFLDKNADEDSVTIALISGGGSSCAEVQREGLTQKDIREANEIMLKSGMPITEMNVIRSHLSSIKAGQLAMHCRGRVRGLIISDVPDNDISVIASGPTAAMNATFEDVKAVILKYGLEKSFPKRIIDYVDSGIGRKVKETPRPSDSRFNGGMRYDSIENIIIADNGMARRAMVDSIRLSYPCMSVEDLGIITGDANDAVDRIFSAISERRKAMLPGEQAAVVWGGETTLNVTGHGIGGRNLHQGLLSLRIMRDKKLRGVTIGYMGTDGRDGKTDAAGAIVDDWSLQQVEKMGLSIDGFINYCDSYRFLRRVEGSTIMVENAYTGTNVADVGCAIF
ncbi:MAG: DUF4147 domain-containing protein [Candidatus Micrarchaeota archaeon]|nr:DUF4147 domain-containing protein [Candidatus Micrarchaeota archaeon]